MAVPVGAVEVKTNSEYLLTTKDEVQFKLRNNATQTKPWLEFVEGDRLRFSIPANGILPVEYGGTGSTNGAAGGGTTTNADALVAGTLSRPVNTTGSVVAVSVTASNLTTAVVGNTNDQPNFTIGRNISQNFSPWSFGNTFIGDGVAASHGATDTMLYNLALGEYAMQYTTNANGCVALGVDALSHAYVGDDNLGIGHGSLGYVTGGKNVAMGLSSGRYFTSNSVAFGSEAALNSTAVGTVAIGYRALNLATTETGLTAVGYQAGNSVSAAGITAFGYSAIGTGDGGAGYLTGVGTYALQKAGSSSIYSTAMGYEALGNATYTYGDVAFGTSAGVGITSNSGIGYNSLFGTSAGDTITSGYRNTIIGGDADVSAAATTNAVAIGYGAVAGNNEVVIGNANTTTNLLKGGLYVPGGAVVGGNLTALGASNYLASVYSPTGSLSSGSIGTLTILNQWNAGLGTNLMGSNVVGSVAYATVAGSVTNVDSRTNTWTLNTPFPLGFGTNLVATFGTATGGFSDVSNAPTNTTRYGEMTIFCSGTLTLTNPAGWYTSDHVDSRICTNGNVVELALKVVPGNATNLVILQSSKR